MPKINPSSIKRPPRQTKKFTLTVGEQEDTLTLRRLSYMERARAEDSSSDLVLRYVGMGDIEATETLPPVDDQPVAASERTFRVASVLVEAQVADNADRYTAEELVMLMQADDVATQLAEMFGWVIAGEPEAADKDLDPKDTSSESSTPPAS